jgi:hypothetical protein
MRAGLSEGKIEVGQRGDRVCQLIVGTAIDTFHGLRQKPSSFLDFSLLSVGGRHSSQRTNAGTLSRKHPRIFLNDVPGTTVIDQRFRWVVLMHLRIAQTTRVRRSHAVPVHVI